MSVSWPGFSIEFLSHSELRKASRRGKGLSCGSVLTASAHRRRRGFAVLTLSLCISLILPPSSALALAPKSRVNEIGARLSQRTGQAAGDVASPWRPLEGMDGKLEINPQTGAIRYSTEGPVVGAQYDLWGVRHGETKAVEFNMIYGAKEIPPLTHLSEKGQLQARQSARTLFEALESKIRAGEGIVVVVSPLMRTKETAQPFIDLVREISGAKLRIVEEEDAREISIGEGEGKMYRPVPQEKKRELEEYGFKEEMSSQEDLDAFRNMRGSNAIARMPNGENYMDVLIRSKRMLEGFNAEYRGKTVVLFGHSAALTSVSVLLRKWIAAQRDEDGGETIDWRTNWPANGECRLLARGASGGEIGREPSREIPASDSLVASLCSMFSSYGAGNALSVGGKEVLALLSHGLTSPGELGFDMERFRGLTQVQIVEQLVLPVQYGGLNDGKNNLFVTPEEYLEGHPRFDRYDKSRGVRTVMATKGCDNDCMFCLLGGRRPVESLAYPVIAQVILRDHLRDKKEGLMQLWLYDEESDTFHYRDKVCAANIADVVFLFRRFPPLDTDRLGLEMRTAGFSPFNPDQDFINDAVTLFQAQQTADNFSVAITFHLFRNEVEEAILQKDKQRLKEVVGAYMRMYKTLILCRRAPEIINRKGLIGTYDGIKFPDTLAMIYDLQNAAMAELKRDREIQEAAVRYTSEGIYWRDYAKPIATIRHLQIAESNDPEIRKFLLSLDAAEIVADALRAPGRNQELDQTRRSEGQVSMAL